MGCWRAKVGDSPGLENGQNLSLLNHSELRYRTLVQLVKGLGKGPAGVHAFGMQAAPEKGRVCAAKAPAPINCSAREMTGMCRRIP